MQPRRIRRPLLSTVLLIISLIANFSAFADEPGLVVLDVTLIGNRHTRDHILLRELTFAKGDTLPTGELEKIFKRSEDNLFNTSLFNSTKITWLRDGDGIRVFVIVTERWYIFPVPIIEVAERNLNTWWKTKDYSRLIYGGSLAWNNFRGRRETFSTTLRLGYTQRMNFYYSVPFLDKARQWGASVSAAFSRNRQNVYNTVDNKQLNFRWDDVYSKNEYSFSGAVSYRPDLYESHFVEAGFRHIEIDDTLLKLNPDYLINGQHTQRAISLRYLFRVEHRDLVVYPLKGTYIDIELGKNGFPVLGDDINIVYLASRFKWYLPLSRRWYWGSSLSTKLSGTDGQPYINTRGLGYGREAIRGYEYYVIDGQRYFLTRNNIKFELMSKKVVQAGFIPLNKFNTIPFSFYLNLFFDAGYVRDALYFNGNPLTNSWQYGYGAGLDLFTYYDLVFRLEYSFNKLGESGIFLHFTAPI